MKIKIKKSTFKRIRKHDISLAGADEVINRAIDALEKKKIRKPKKSKKRDLRGARILSATINGDKLKQTEWRGVLLHILKLAGNSKSLREIDEMFSIVRGIKRGCTEGYEFNYIKEIDATIGSSLQSPQYAEAIEQIASIFGFTVDIDYMCYGHNINTQWGSIQVNL